MVNYCYILANACNQTYNGYTNNLSRRVRQHNSEIKGGARYTCGKGPWEYIAVITCDDEAFTMRRALSLEWSIKYPTNKRPRPREYQGASGRINSLSLVFSNCLLYTFPEPTRPLYISYVVFCLKKKS